jgi:hypothetical protein
LRPENIRPAVLVPVRHNDRAVADLNKCCVVRPDNGGEERAAVIACFMVIGLGGCSSRVGRVAHPARSSRGIDARHLTTIAEEKLNVGDKRPHCDRGAHIRVGSAASTVADGDYEHLSQRCLDNGVIGAVLARGTRSLGFLLFVGWDLSCYSFRFGAPQFSKRTKKWRRFS